MDATEALISAELSMRSLVREVLGDEWRSVHGLPSEKDIEDRQRGESNSRPGVEVSRDPLDYLYIKELRSILSQTRQRFKDVFENQPRVEVLFGILADYRNAPFHARNLTWFERDLVTGAAGYITAAITRWRNSQDVNYELDYPRILTVVDEWGNEYRSGADPYRFRYGDEAPPKVAIQDPRT